MVITIKLDMESKLWQSQQMKKIPKRVGKSCPF